MLEYINTKYKPSKTDVIVEYHVIPDGISLEQAAEQIAAESSIGTWTDLTTMNQRVAKKLKPQVFSIDKTHKEIKIAYHADLFEEGNSFEHGSIGLLIYLCRASTGTSAPLSRYVAMLVLCHITT